MHWLPTSKRITMACLAPGYGRGVAPYNGGFVETRVNKILAEKKYVPVDSVSEGFKRSV